MCVCVPQNKRGAAARSSDALEVRVIVLAHALTFRNNEEFRREGDKVEPVDF